MKQMVKDIRKILPTALLALVLVAILASTEARLHILSSLRWKIYDSFTKLAYKVRPLPQEISDIILVLIDNKTIKNAPHRWPYPRSDFAKVVHNLRSAGARIIGFDFVFPAESTPQEDEILLKELESSNNLVMACVVDEEGNLTLPFLSANNTPIPAGIITKLRDRDGLTRKNLTYLVSEKEPNKGFLSWEMLLLKMREGVDISTFKINGKYLYFSNKEQEKWKIPVDPKTKSFLISFRAHTADFNRLSFYDILNGDFDRNLIKDRVVLIGLASVLMGDLHNTPLGWLPGITLNANAFLALYGHNFIKSLPGLIDIVIAAIGAVIAILIFLNFTFRKAFCLAILELIIFLAGSFILFLFGYTFDYALTVVMIIITAIVVRIMPTRYRPLECPDPSVVSLCLKEPQNHKLR